MGETAFSRILWRGRSGALAGWNPDNPVGLNPAWEQELRDLGVTRPNGSRGTVLQAINEALLHSGASALDMAGKGVGAAYGGGVGALTGVAEELGAPRTEALERDLMAVPESVLGGVGGLGRARAMTKGAARQAPRQVRKASQAAQAGAAKAKDLHTAFQLERLIRFGGPPVRVGKLTENQLDLMKRVLPPEAYQAFFDGDRMVTAEKGLRDSLRAERPKHADRLIRRMPELTREGSISGNHNPAQAHRPMLSLPSPHKEKTFDTMILDALLRGQRIGVPSIHTMPERTLRKGKKP